MLTLKQRMVSQRWLFIRVLLCAVSGLGGFFNPLSEGTSDPDEDLNSVMSVSIAVLILFPFALVGYAMLKAVSRSNRNARWHKPDWKSRPFFQKGPNHFLHLCACTGIAYGLGASIAYVTNQHADLVSSVVPIVMGGSILVGITMTQGIFAGRYEPLPDDVQEVRLPLRNELMIAAAWLGGFLFVVSMMGTMAYLTYLSLPAPNP